MLHDNRTAVLKVRFTPEEYKMLQEYAASVYTPASAVVRSLVMSYIYEQDTTPFVND